ncbi:hypothetical protein AA0113_g4578 [Alternaria arborescens]|uniref:Uncharacterized protein n=1 Tax=Alternaria arborescens TaxID=156630 RepID=A0A4Q4SAW4_9PLEO|nr:hypothetical protein AA0113_g4578 [Alternaria arborescens]
MNFLSIIAEAKGEKAPIKKATLKFKTAPAPKRKTAKATSTASLASKGAKTSPTKHSSAVANALTLCSPKFARKRETARRTSTASPAFRVEKRTVAKHSTPIPKALSRRLPTPVQSSTGPEEAAPRHPLPKPATVIRDANYSAKSVDDTIAELLAPHPLAVKQAAERDAHEKAVQQPARQERRQAPRRRQPAVSKADEQKTSRRRQQVFEPPKPFAPKEERRPKRQSKASYENMSQRDLLNEVQFRTLELDFDEKKYLVEVLVINDKAYFESMEMLGDPLEAVEFALGEVKQHNKEMRQERAAAAAKAAAERTKRERKEALKVQQQAKHKVQEKKRQDEREKTGKLAPKKKEVEEKVKEEKHAVEAPKQERKRKRKISQGADDSGYFSKSSSPPETGKKDDEASLKGNKRVHSTDNDDDEDKTPTKKAKSSKPPQPPQPPVASRTIKPKRKPAALPRAMQAGANRTSSGKDKDVEMSDQVDSDVVVPAKRVEKTTKKTARVDARNTDLPQVSKRRTRSTRVVGNEEDKDMEDTDEDAEDDDAFVVDDGYKSTRKSRPKAKEVQKFFSGMR